jgi:hypothetical protein
MKVKSGIGNHTEDGSLHGACCRACLFAPEASCERNNRYLDRSLLVPTGERSDLTFCGSTSDRSLCWRLGSHPQGGASRC